MSTIGQSLSPLGHIFNQTTQPTLAHRESEMFLICLRCMMFCFQRGLVTAQLTAQSSAPEFGFQHGCSAYYLWSLLPLALRAFLYFVSISWVYIQFQLHRAR